MFKGIHNINLDGKGRLTIPTKYRNTISDQSNGNMVVTIDSEEKCLLLYPATIFSNIENKIKEFNKNIAIRNKEIVNLRKKVRLNFAKELKKILNDYSTQNSIQMILKQEDILIGSKNLDISNDILKIIDSNKIKLIE